MKTLKGKLYVYSGQGEGNHLVFYSNEKGGGFNNTYSFEDAEYLKVLDKGNKVLWEGNPKGRNLLACIAHQIGVFPEALPLEKSKDFLLWCYNEQKAELTGNMKPWGRK